MVILLQMLAILINLLIVLSTLRKTKYKLKTIYIILLIFQVVFVFPIILEWFFGIQDISYKSPGFDKALNDTVTNNIYSVFVIITSLGLYIVGARNNHGKNIAMVDIKESLSKLKINRGIYIVFFILMFTPLILALLSPSPDKYFMHYAYFQKFGAFARESELWYHRNVLRIGGFISLIAILVTKLFSKDKPVNNLVIYTAAIIAGILNGKRTLFAYIIFAILAVDILKSPKGKFPIKKIITSISLIVIVFISYAFIIDKHTMNVSTLDNLRLYFFRDIDVKFSIYALLNPEHYKILDYWGQSYIFNIFFYIPRIIWESKPYPYDIYVTATSLNYPRGTVVPWNFQTSIFGEALSNLGWIGIPFTLTLINKFIKISERSGNPIIILLGLLIIVSSFMNHFGSYRNVLLIWLLLVIINKFFKKSVSKITRGSV